MTTETTAHTVKFHRADSEYRVLNGAVIVDRFRFDAYDFSDRRRAYRDALADAGARNEAAELAEAAAWLDVVPVVTPEPTPKTKQQKRFIASKCDRCGKTTPANQNGIGDLFTLPEAFGPPMMDEGDFCADCCARYDRDNWLVWLRTHRPSIFLSFVSAPLPNYTLIPGTVSSPAEMLEAVADYRHAVNTGAQYLLSFQECPQIWAGVWARLSAEEREDVLAGAHLAGATAPQLAAMARVQAVHGAPGLMIAVQAA